MGKHTDKRVKPKHSFHVFTPSLNAYIVKQEEENSTSESQGDSLSSSSPNPITITTKYSHRYINENMYHYEFQTYIQAYPYLRIFQ